MLGCRESRKLFMELGKTETHRDKTAEQAVTVVLTLKKGTSPLCHQKA